MTLMQKVFIIGIVGIFLASTLFLMRFYSNEFHSPNNVSALNIEVRDLIEGTRPVPNLAVNATISTVPEKSWYIPLYAGLTEKNFIVWQTK